MLLELAVADAYGAGFEYADPAFIRERNTLARYVQNPRHPTLQPGHYTDDTQMSIALAELLLDHQRWGLPEVADAVVRTFKRDPRPGYAGGFYGLLQDVQSGAELLDRIRPHSAKNGAAMRSLPLGVLPEKRLRMYAAVQAALTHDTAEGIRSATAAAMLSRYFLQNLGPREEAGLYLEQTLGGRWNLPWNGPVQGNALDTVQAAVTAIREEDSLTRILKRAVSFGGDTDTVATIAVGAASCSRSVPHDLPDALVAGLENGPYGRDYLRALDERLFATFKP